MHAAVQDIRAKVWLQCKWARSISDVTRPTQRRNFRWAVPYHSNAKHTEASILRRILNWFLAHAHSDIIIIVATNHYEPSCTDASIDLYISFCWKKSNVVPDNLAGQPLRGWPVRLGTRPIIGPVQWWKQHHFHAQKSQIHLTVWWFAFPTISQVN